MLPVAGGHVMVLASAEQGLGSPDAGLLLLRVLVGVPFSLHGFQKLFGWFGGGGFAGTAEWFRGLGFGGGRAAALGAGAAEVAGGLGLALGLLTPFAAMAVVGTMTVAAFVNNESNGFWSASKGWELNGYLIVVAAAVTIIGPGRWSLDRAMGLKSVTNSQVALVAVAAGLLAGAIRWFTRSVTRPDKD